MRIVVVIVCVMTSVARGDGLAAVVLEPAAPQADRWLLVFHTTRDSEPGAMYKTMTQVGQGSGRVERLTTPIEQFTIRAAGDGGQPAFIMEWGARRVRVPVREAR